MTWNKGKKRASITFYTLFFSVLVFFVFLWETLVFQRNQSPDSVRGGKTEHRSHIAQNVRWKSILGPKIQLTSILTVFDEHPPDVPFLGWEMDVHVNIKCFEMDIHWMYHLGWEMDVDFDKIQVWKQ